MLFPLPKPFPRGRCSHTEYITVLQIIKHVPLHLNSIFHQSHDQFGEQNQVPTAKHMASSSLQLQAKLKRMESKGVKRRGVSSTEQASKQMWQHIFGGKQTEVERKPVQHQQHKGNPASSQEYLCPAPQVSLSLVFGFKSCTRRGEWKDAPRSLHSAEGRAQLSQGSVLSLCE